MKKTLRPQITCPGICKKARKTLRKQTFILTWQIIEAALESMKQNKNNDLDVSDLPSENAKIDELARHVYYTATRRLILSEAKSSVPFPPTGSFINEQSVTIPNLLYNLIKLILTEDQSDRPISDLEVEMSGTTNMRVVSFT